MMNTLSTMLGGHLIATLYNQIPMASFSRLGRSDPFATIPVYRFFAPNPSVTDYRLFARGIRAEGSSEWVDIQVRPKRGGISVIWDPDSRVTKGVFDLMMQLSFIFSLEDGETIQNNGVYRALEKYVLERCRLISVLAEERTVQFCILETTGFDESMDPVLVFASARISMA